MNKHENQFIPALGFDFLTPLYDPIVCLTTREKTIKSVLVQQINLAEISKRMQENELRILDLACGTATLTVALKQSYPHASIYGLDGDRKVLEIARRKIEKASAEIRLDEGLSFAMPYADDHFDAVVSSLFFHHLTPANKRRTFIEVLRVLKPGGRLHVADWGRPANFLMYVASLPIRWLDGPTTRDNFDGKLPEVMSEAGLVNISETKFFICMFGTIRIQTAEKPLKIKK